MEEMNTETFDKRIKIGERGQAELEALLRSMDFTITPTGQEKFIPGVIHDDVRHIHDDPTVRALRFQPDFMAYREDFPVSYWESKVNTVGSTPNFALEKACYEELMSRHQRGQRCIVAFKEVTGTWAVAWVQDIVVAVDMSARRHEANGSKTPYLLVRKSSFLELKLFITVNTTGTEPTTYQARML